MQKPPRRGLRSARIVSCCPSDQDDQGAGTNYGTKEPGRQGTRHNPSCLVPWSRGPMVACLTFSHPDLPRSKSAGPCHVIGPIDLPTWNGAYRRLRPCTGSTAAVHTAAGRGLFRPIGTELPPVGNRITTSRQLTLPRRSYYVVVSNASMRLEQNQRPVRGTSVDRAAFR